MFCMYCGNRLPDNALFCNQCGSRQNTATIPTNPSMTNTFTEGWQESSGTVPFAQHPTQQSNYTPTTLGTPPQLNSPPIEQRIYTRPEQPASLPQEFRFDRKAGFIIAGIGAIVGIVSFFLMPYLSYGFITATGQQLASLGYQFGNQYNSSYSSSNPQFNALELLWLLPVVAGIIILIAGVQLFRSNETGKKASASWLIALATVAILGLLGAYIYLTIQIQSSTTSSVSLTSVIGSGIWIYIIAMVAVIVGGILQIRSSQ
jgi:zinc-ribbon domain